MMGRIRNHKDLDVFKRSVTLATSIFEMTRSFLKEERYSLTDQIRRSSRSVCANVTEAFRRRRYRASFVSRMNDAEVEAAETQVWIEIAHRCRYIEDSKASRLDAECDMIIAQIVTMIRDSTAWTIRAT